MKTYPQRLLVGESFSPWTKKARWAMEHCGLVYDYREYVPTLSELNLRIRLRQIIGPVSVPILFAGTDVYRGSWQIAGYANQCTDDQRLGDMKGISDWDILSENALAEGRTRVVRSILANNQALKEALPVFIPQWLRHPMRFLARDAAKRLDRKYAHLHQPGSLRLALDAVRKGLAKSSDDYLLGGFSYADITMATILEVVKPVAHHQPPLGPETQEIWHDHNLSNHYIDLIEWRNRLAADATTSYSQFRKA